MIQLFKYVMYIVLKIKKILLKSTVIGAYSYLHFPLGPFISSFKESISI